ncbi:MAG: hypothetical protein JRH11_10295 [Deltaproteobacteria bacterium]|nr:hypothetical protein [Deltaproteobacteria bacterium]
MAHMLKALLGVVLSAALALLSRSLFLHVWLTAALALGVLVGVVAAYKGRVWGYYVLGASAALFCVAAALGSGPWWFWALGGVTALPAAAVSRPLLRADWPAALTALVIAVALGAGAAAAHHRLVHLPGIEARLDDAPILCGFAYAHIMNETTL